MEINFITGQIVDAAIKVHSALGPGLLEKTYEICLKFELRRRGFTVDSQHGLPVRYEDIEVEAGYRVDLLVQNLVIVEIKSVETMHPIFFAQTLTYLRLSRRTVGLLINFNVEHLKDGIKRIVNKYAGPLPRDS